MIALLQRVKRASVTIDGNIIANINSGLLVFVGLVKDDTERQAARLAERLLNYRIFADDQDRMNLSLRDTGGEVLLVPQFTLAADTRSGHRPSFTPAAEPEKAQHLFAQVVAIMQQQADAGVLQQVQTGRFGADMAVELINDGPVTFWLET